MFFHWLPLAVAITGACFLIYLGVQQNYRQSLNDPQVQMAEDAVTMLLSGKQVTDVVGADVPFDAGKSLRPFIAVYDENGNLTLSSAIVNGVQPVPPRGIFDYARQYGENRVTWQPAPGTRIALVVRPAPIGLGSFVVAGRNMREVESRDTQFLHVIIFGWLVILFATFLCEIFGELLSRRKGA